MAAKKQGATREFVTSKSRTPAKKPTKTSAAYKKARIAQARQKREIERQKREKLIFALFVVIILVMILFAILVFKNLLVGDDTPSTESDSTHTEETFPPNDDPDEYKTVSVAKSAVSTGNLILINSDKPYVTKPSNLKNIYSSRRTFYSEARGKNVYSYYPYDSTPELDEKALEALNNLSDAFYEATGNNDLFIKRAYTEDSAEHQKGTSVDFSIYTLEGTNYSLDDGKFASTFKWFFDNYHKYGFIMRYPDDKSDITGVSGHENHFRYVGVPHSTYITENGLCLEEYLDVLHSTAANGADGIKPLTVTASDGSTYNIYYVKADGDVINIPIIGDGEYGISGDNCGGFIVHVKIN